MLDKLLVGLKDNRCRNIRSLAFKPRTLKACEWHKVHHCGAKLKGTSKPHGSQTRLQD